jgi:hypothetical protein
LTPGSGEDAGAGGECGEDGDEAEALGGGGDRGRDRRGEAVTGLGNAGRCDLSALFERAHALPTYIGLRSCLFRNLLR